MEDVPLVDDLIYDLGLHKGEDSAFYLAKGYRVVAFEADPNLIDACRGRFSDEIAAGRMTIIEGAITDSDRPTVSFYRHPADSGWGTTSDEWVERNRAAGEAELVEVPSVNFVDTLRKTGMPSLMKIDVEGADRLCLESLLSFEQRPEYISVEMNPHYTDPEDAGSDLALLERLGYNRFALVQQASIPGTQITTKTLSGEPLTYRFEHGSSGPFGKAVGPWVDGVELRGMYRRRSRSSRMIRPLMWWWRRHGSPGRGVLTRIARLLPQQGGTGWYDVHAAKSTGWNV